MLYLFCRTVLIHYLSLISCTRELWKIWLLETKWKEQTSNAKIWDPALAKNIWDSEMQKSAENKTSETHQKCFQDFDIGPKFSETHIFQGTVLYPSNAKCSLHQTLFISLFTPSNDWYWRDFCYVCFIACLENCRVVTFVHHIISQSFFFTLKRNKGHSIHHLTFFDLSLNKSILHKFCFTHYAGPQLKVVSTMSVGFDHVSLPDAAKR